MMTQTKTRTLPVALLMVAALLMSFLTQLSTAWAEPAQAQATGGPGETIVLTDSNGNTVSYSIKVLSTGTGHGTTQQCWINETTGHNPGDNTAGDDYFCIFDSVTYEISWNADIKTLDPAPVAQLRFRNAYTDGTAMTFKGNTRTSFNGALGGTSVGFTGEVYTDNRSGNHPGADMTFTSVGVRAGSWTMTLRPEETPGGIDMELGVTFGGTSATTHADRITHALGLPRHDLRHHFRLADPTLTGIDGELYQGIEIRSNLHETVGGPERTAYPGFQADKGYRGRYGQRGHFPDQDVRWGMVNPPAGTLVSVDGSDPQPLTLDGDLGYVLARQGASVKFYMPWDSLADGVNEFTTRIDPLDVLVDTAGNPTMEGGPDPGVGLACTTTTAGVKPGASRGNNGYDNNNCGLTVVDKRSYDTTFDKKLQGFGGRLTLPDGTNDPIGRTAVSTYSATNREREFFTARLEITPPPVGSGRDIAVCDVWDSGEQILHSTSFTANGQPLHTLLPMAQVLYTTQDLRPAGAPLGDDWNPLCGSPADTSTWSTEPPADLKDVSGVMFVIPGDDVLQQPVYFDLRMRTRLGADYENMITPNVRDYMGYSIDTTVADPVWMGDSEHMTVYRAWWELGTGYENNSALPIGRTTYTTTLNPSTGYHGAPVPGAIFVERVYLDHCMLNPQVELTGTDVVDVEFHAGAQDPTRCGTLSDSYYEITYQLPADFRTDQRFTPARLTWTTPVDSAPGDTYTLHSSWTSPDEDLLIFLTSADGYPKTYTVQNSAAIGAEKLNDDLVIEKDETFTHTVGWFNYSPGSGGRTQWIDVLPWNGDAGVPGSSTERTPATDYTGTLWLESVTQAGGEPDRTGIEYTSRPHAEISEDPADPSNATDGSTTWCAEADFGTAGCPADITETTALRFTTYEFSPGLAQYFDLNFGTSGNLAEDIYTNRLSLGASDLFDLPVPSPQPVTTVVVDSSIAGTVFHDADRSTVHDGDPLEDTLAGHEVELLDPDGDVIATTTTDENGDYIFDGLHSGDYQVRLVDPAPWLVITVVGQDVGADATDRTSHTIDLGIDEDITGVDIGLWSPSPAISLVKSWRFAEGSDTDGDGIAGPGDQVIYTLAATNVGNTDMVSVTFDDPMLAALGLEIVPGSCTIDGEPSGYPAGLAQGQTLACDYQPMEITTGHVEANEPILNTATAVGTPEIGDEVTDEDSEEVPVEAPNPSLSIVKEAELGDHNGNGLGDVDEWITWSIVVTNDGNVPVDATTMVDAYATSKGQDVAGMSCNLYDADGQFVVAVVNGQGTLVPGDTMECYLQTQIAADEVGQEILNIASVTGTYGDDPVDGGEDDAEVPTIVPDPETEMTKTWEWAEDVNNDGLAGPGDSIRYTVTLKNIGNVPLTGASISDPMIPAWASCSVDSDAVIILAVSDTYDLAPGRTLTCTGIVEVTEAQSCSADDLVNVATSTAFFGEEEVTGRATATVPTEQDASCFGADIAVVKSGPDGLASGASFAVVGPDGQTPMVVGEDGSTFTLEALPYGDYQLVETGAPEGLNLLAEPVGFTLGPDGIEITSGGSRNITVGGDGFTIEVTDTPAWALPMTGGAGLDHRAGLTLALALMAGALLLTASTTRRKAGC